MLMIRVHDHLVSPSFNRPERRWKIEAAIEIIIAYVQIQYQERKSAKMAMQKYPSCWFRCKGAQPQVRFLSRRDEPHLQRATRVRVCIFLFMNWIWNWNFGRFVSIGGVAELLENLENLLENGELGDGVDIASNRPRKLVSVFAFCFSYLGSGALV